MFSLNGIYNAVIFYKLTGMAMMLSSVAILSIATSGKSSSDEHGNDQRVYAFFALLLAATAPAFFTLRAFIVK